MLTSLKWVSIKVSALFLIALWVFGTAIPTVAQPNLQTLFGPAEFVRSKGKPVIEKLQFSITGYESPFILHLRSGDDNGENRPSSAWVWLNGEPAFEPSDFNQQVSGYDLEVELTDPSSVEVKLASKPGSKLTIWIEGRPSDTVPEVTLDNENSVSESIVSEIGGMLEILGADGKHYTLTIPEGALGEQISETITMTPILDVKGLPENGTFKIGVRLEPHGIRLFKPVTLEMKLPNMPPPYELVALCYNGPDWEYYAHPLFAVDTDNSTTTLQIMSFSDWVTFTSAECPELGDPMSQADIYKHAISCLCKAAGWDTTAVDINLFNNILTDWFAEFVLLKLMDANDLNTLEQATLRYLEWRIHVDAFSSSEYFEKQNAAAKVEMLRVIQEQIEEFDSNCEEVDDLCGKKEAFDTFLKWLSTARALDLGVDLPDPHDFCEGLAYWLATTVDITKEARNFFEGETLELKAELKNTLNDPIFDGEKNNLQWSSSDESIVSIESIPTNENAVIIQGISKGNATITARAGCDAVSTVEIEVKEAPSVKLNPEEGALSIGDTLELTATVIDADGNPIPGGCRSSIDWTFPATDTISFNIATDTTTAIVTGVEPGVATIEAACEGSSGTAVITVRGGNCDELVYDVYDEWTDTELWIVYDESISGSEVTLAAYPLCLSFPNCTGVVDLEGLDSACDADGILHVVYALEYEWGFETWHMYMDSSGWSSPERIPEIDDSAGSPLSLTFDSSGKWELVYGSWTDDTLSINYFNSSTATEVTLAAYPLCLSFPNCTGVVDLEGLDSVREEDGRLHIVYILEYVGGFITYGIYPDVCTTNADCHPECQECFNSECVPLNVGGSCEFFGVCNQNGECTF